MTESAAYQSDVRAPEPATLPALRHLLQVSREMRDELGGCLKHPHTELDVETVHQLRTGTRRVEATLETLAREAGARGLGARTEQARQRWLRQLKKVRQTAGAVRDLDVHREILDEHYLPEHMPARDDMGREAIAAAQEPLLTKQARALDAWLASRRASAADALRTALDGREQKLEAAEQEFIGAFARRRSAAAAKAPRAAALRALEDYLRLMDAMPHLDTQNLHDFRKGAKKARYVAEAGGDDAASVALTKAIKRVQDAIGDWHDWEVLAQESRQALGKDGAALEAELDRCVEREYARALRIAAIIGRRMVGEWQAVRPPRRRASTRAPRAQ